MILAHVVKKATLLYIARQHRKSLREVDAGDLCLIWVVYWHGGFSRIISNHVGMALANKTYLQHGMVNAHHVVKYLENKSRY